LLVEKELKSKLSEEISKIYQKQLEQMEQQLNIFRKQIKIYESENKEFVRSEVEKEREKYRIVLDEKDKQLNRMTENYEKFLKQNEVKSSKKIGDEGEDAFVLMSETFKDFPGYKLEKKAHQAHKGDIHLLFYCKSPFDSIQQPHFAPLLNNYSQFLTLIYSLLV